jgi:DNA-binding CsgD family transcriptional regulator
MRSKVPRYIAADALKSGRQLSPLSSKAVDEVLLSEIAVCTEAQLISRLNEPRHRIYYHWRRDFRDNPVGVKTFIILARRLRAAELIQEGATIFEAAARLGVDESTVYRDLRATTARGQLDSTSDVSLVELLAAFNLIGRAVPQTHSGNALLYDFA